MLCSCVSEMKQLGADRSSFLLQGKAFHLSTMDVMSYDFFGDQMTKAVAATEAEAEKQKRNKAGLDAVLASLQAAKKVNVLDKSRSDWKDFKKSDIKVRPGHIAPICLIDPSGDTIAQPFW